MAGPKGHSPKATFEGVHVISETAFHNAVEAGPLQKAGTRKSKRQFIRDRTQAIDYNDDKNAEPDDDHRASFSDGDEEGSSVKKTQRQRDEEHHRKHLSWITDFTLRKTPKERKPLAMDEYWNMIVLRDREIIRLKDVNQQKYKKLKDLRDGRVKNLNKKLEKKSSNLGKAQAETDSVQEQVKDLQEQLQKAKEENEEKDATISSMISERLELLDKGDMPFLPDDVVKDSLDKLFRETRNWARQWGIDDWVGISSYCADNISKLLTKLFPEFASQRALDAATRGRIAPKILLLGIVNFILCRRTFMRPFDLLRNDAKDGRHDQEMDRLQVAFNYLKRRTKHASHRLRALVMLGHAPNDDQELSLIEEDYPPQLKSLIDRNSKAILQSVIEGAGALIKHQDDGWAGKRQAELLEIIRSFVAEAVILNAQHPFLEFRFRSHLKGLTFSLEHESLVGHPKLGLREDVHDTGGISAEEAGISGQPIDIVVEPAVLRSGGKDGTGYDKKRRLIKAVVWMVKPCELEGTSRVGLALSTNPDVLSSEAGRSQDLALPKMSNALPKTDVASTFTKSRAVGVARIADLGTSKPSSAPTRPASTQGVPRNKDESDIKPQISASEQNKRKREQEGGKPNKKKQLTRDLPAQERARKSQRNQSTGGQSQLSDSHFQGIVTEQAGNKTMKSHPRSNATDVSKCSNAAENRKGPEQRSENSYDEIRTPPLNPRG